MTDPANRGFGLVQPPAALTYEQTHDDPERGLSWEEVNARRKAVEAARNVSSEAYPLVKIPDRAEGPPTRRPMTDADYTEMGSFGPPVPPGLRNQVEAPTGDKPGDPDIELDADGRVVYDKTVRPLGDRIASYPVDHHWFAEQSPDQKLQNELAIMKLRNRVQTAVAPAGASMVSNIKANIPGAQAAAQRILEATRAPAPRDPVSFQREFSTEQEANEERVRRATENAKKRP